MGQIVQFPEARVSAGKDFRDAVLMGLSLQQKSVPSRFFYDARGSELFERITELPEYYPTRTEIRLLKSCGPDIGKLLPSEAVVVEFGSGSSRKTELLLHALERPTAYIPIEISAAALYPAARRIAKAFPGLGVHPILGGFHDLDGMKLPLQDHFCVGFFPGSTIGNFNRTEAVLFLRSVRRLLGKKAALLVGADLQKPLDVLLPAYNDAAGVTAAFNLNLLSRINRELSGTFDLAAFEHSAIYNDRKERIEMHLRSVCDQRASVAGRSFSFQAGETIHTENSHKYSLSGFRWIAARGGWETVRSWADENRHFSLHLLT
ncbi:MAG TPA: L-histidine N(alpha)-methyltransferase [Geobacterales bacterium]|jgi:dimethylhistidine N-methyltransferase|nr:L-histidine N(alpha)-methyltransferase [Geobacterales bacterium]